jgi:hypothetical protein
VWRNLGGGGHGAAPSSARARSLRTLGRVLEPAVLDRAEELRLEEEVLEARGVDPHVALLDLRRRVGAVRGSGRWWRGLHSGRSAGHGAGGAIGGRRCGGGARPGAHLLRLGGVALEDLLLLVVDQLLLAGGHGSGVRHVCWARGLCRALRCCRATGLWFERWVRPQGMMCVPGAAARGLGFQEGGRREPKSLTGFPRRAARARRIRSQYSAGATVEELPERADVCGRRRAAAAPRPRGALQARRARPPPPAL